MPRISKFLATYMSLPLMTILLVFAQASCGLAQIKGTPAYVGSSAKKELTEEEIKGCYYCHTTGYGKQGGFVSPEKTPHLKNAGCEVCHGPGDVHIKTTDASHIKGTLTTEDCEACHISERVRAFRYKPLIHGGAH